MTGRCLPMARCSWLPAGLVVVVCLMGQVAAAAPLEFIRVSDDRSGFVLADSGRAWRPLGFNYDHDSEGRLLEDYWVAEWSAVVADFQEMRQLQATVVRIHLQFGRFMRSATEPNPEALQQLAQLVRLAEETGLYLDLTGLGCYHKADVPPWYDQLDRQARWDAQCVFWKAVAAVCAASPAIFCYDLMNEPVVAGGRREDWLGGAFGGKHFVQFVSLDPGEGPRWILAKQWIDQLVATIRQQDQRHLITVGLVDWSLDRPGLTSGFVPDKVTQNLDFLCVHLYPKSGKVAEATETLHGFQLGKPVVVEEIFPLGSSVEECLTFIHEAGTDAAGWISFYWGRTPAEYAGGTTLAEAVTGAWLTAFSEKVLRPAAPQ